MISTLMLPNWTQVEINQVFHLLKPYFNNLHIMILLVVVAGVTVLLFYNRYPFLIETLAITIPFITIGNFVQLWNRVAGFIVHLSLFVTVVIVYWRTEMDLLWFDGKYPYSQISILKTLKSIL